MAPKVQRNTKLGYWQGDHTEGIHNADTGLRERRSPRSPLQENSLGKMSSEIQKSLCSLFNTAVHGLGTQNISSGSLKVACPAQRPFCIAQKMLLPPLLAPRTRQILLFPALEGLSPAPRVPGKSKFIMHYTHWGHNCYRKLRARSSLTGSTSSDLTETSAEGELFWVRASAEGM